MDRAGKGMKKRPRSSSGNLKYNLRSIKEPIISAHEQVAHLRLADRVQYLGNPGHKRNPGDFNLTPPAAPRQNATLCDEAKVYTIKEAQNLLVSGLLSGLISERDEEGFPKQIWAVKSDGTVFEAQLENSVQGHYHGYPLPLGDPFRQVVLDRLKRS